jgi:hypothetical protein
VKIVSYHLTLPHVNKSRSNCHFSRSSRSSLIYSLPWIVLFFLNGRGTVKAPRRSDQLMSQQLRIIVVEQQAPKCRTLKASTQSIRPTATQYMPPRSYHIAETQLFLLHYTYLIYKSPSICVCPKDRLMPCF